MHVVPAQAADKVLSQAASLGVSPRRLAAAAGLDLAPAERPAWIANATLLALYEAAARLCGDAHFGLRLGASLDPAAFGALGRCTAGAATFGQALDSLLRHLPRWTNASRLELRLCGAQARLSYRVYAPASLARQDAEATLAVFAAMARRAGLAGPVRQVAFAHARPTEARQVESAFGARALFDQPENALVFERAWLDQGLPGADAHRARLCERETQCALREGPRQALRERVGLALAEGLLDASGPTLDATARRLGTSARSLQRRLAERGLSYARLLDDERRRLALLCLSAGRPLDETARRLGFAERAPFHRAFRRWTGGTPGRWLATA